MKTLYAAYGSNLNLEQMALRCPSAEVYGKGMINGYRLVFNGVASIEPDQDGQVPVGVWLIDDDCERSLDRYEGFPRLYRKETIDVQMHDGEIAKCMVYIMNYGERALPYKYYYDIIAQGYDEIGLDRKFLREAVLSASWKSNT